MIGVRDRRSIDLLALVGEDTRLRKVASTRGGEFAGPCPFCGGRDRFRVQPEQGLWVCRQCSEEGRWQDGIAYVMKREGSGFRDACRRLDLQENCTKLHHAEAPAPARIEPPNALWQARGRAFVAYAQEQLWNREGRGALTYVRGRGLDDKTIRRNKLGFNPKALRLRPELWGLGGGPVYLARGILIPGHFGADLWYLKIRRPVWGDALDRLIGRGGDRKYGQLRGGRPALFGAGNLRGRDLALVLEGEFDAMLADQVAGDLVGAVTLGSASGGPSPEVLWALRDARRVLVAYDADKPGQQGAARWLDKSPRARLLQPPAKDVTEYHQAGGDVRAWIVAVAAEYGVGEMRSAEGGAA